MKSKTLFYQLIFCLLSLFSIEKHPLFAEEKIVFLHIPKTGGVTVSSLLMNEYHFDQISGPDPLLYSYGFHYSLYEMSQMMDPSNFKLITFLRNPINRVLSEQSYCIDKYQGDPSILQAHKLPIQGEPIETARNVVCKMLSGLDDQDPNIPIETHLKHAKKNLEQKFFFVGITEKMDESIELLYAQFGWQLPEEIPYFNITESTDHHYPSKVLRAIAEKNWADIELYEYALTLYEKQKNQILSLPPNPSQNNQVFHDSYHYRFDQRLRGYGWGPRENNHKNYRWVSGKNEAAIDFYLNSKQDLLLKFHILIQPILLNQLSASINNTPIKINCKTKHPNDCTSFKWVKCYAKVPKNLLIKGEKTRLIFKMQPPTEPFSLALYNQNSDIKANYLRGKFACKQIDLKIYRKHAPKLNL